MTYQMSNKKKVFVFFHDCGWTGGVVVALSRIVIFSGSKPPEVRQARTFGCARMWQDLGSTPSQSNYIF